MITVNNFIRNYSISLPSDLCPIYEDESWRLVKIKDLQPRHLPTLETTAKKIVEMCKGSFQVSGMENAVVRINSIWTQLRIGAKLIGAAENGEVIRFNSMHKTISWLSNFFPSLILDLEKQRVYLTLEHGYVLFKGEMAGFNFEALNELIDTESPREAKQRGFRVWERQTTADEEASLVEMERLVHLKFLFNPILQTLLKRTGELEIRENTGDPYWGTAFDQILTDDSNHLGKILMAVRGRF